MRILALTSSFGLFNPNSGGTNRFYNLIKQLSKENEILVLLPEIYKHPSDNTVGNTTYFRASVKGLTFKALNDFNPFFIKKLVNIIRNNELDIIQISHPFGLIAARFITWLFKKNPFIILDAHNVESKAIESVETNEVSLSEKILASIYIKYVPKLEKQALKYADYILAVSEEDKILFNKLYDIDMDKIILIPSGVNIRKLDDKNCLESDLNRSKHCIFFHGSYSHPPNQDAITFITEYIAPKISDADFLIAGYGMPEFNQSNVKSVGFVEDLYSLMEKVDMAIVPVVRGGGTRLKIMDYLIMGLPIVSTKKGIEGINVVEGVNAYITDSVNEKFIEKVRLLMEDDNKQQIMGRNNRKLALEEYDYNKIGLKLNSFYKELVENKNGI